MNTKLVTCAGIALSLLLSGTVFAAGFAPPNYAFLINGAGNLTRNTGGTAIWPCQWNFKMLSGASIGGSPARASGGTMSGGTAPAGTNCNVMTIGPSTWSITSSSATGGNGVFHGLTFYQSGSVFCSTAADVPFTVTVNADGTTSFVFNYAAIGSGCSFVAQMTALAAASIVP